MGTFVFRWPHAATEVFVTGTFDDWAKSVKLEKKGDVFEKEVHLPNADEKVYYKFVVDTVWTTDSHAREENDGHNNLNNVLLPEDITKSSDSGYSSLTGGNTAAAAMAGVTPESTTAALAKDVPLEESSPVPGTFPETPAAETQQFSVNPIPATNGIGNPVKLEPGEKVPEPSEFTTNTINSTVTTDKAGYERDASYPVTGPSGAEETKPADALEVPPLTKDTIPESSLPMDAPLTNAADQTVTIQSAAPTATTAALAAAVPLESQKQQNGEPLSGEVPEVVKESISEARQEPEATANPEAVEEKKAVEAELQQKLVSEAPAPPAKDVPEIVKESMGEVHRSPEAAANSEAVEEKKEVEAELQKKIAPTEAVGEPAPTTTAKTTLTAPQPTKPAESVDVSPKTTSPLATPAQPEVTTGVGAAKTSEVSAPPKEESSSAAAPDSPATKESKKKNRRSGFFGKLKEKLSHKDK